MDEPTHSGESSQTVTLTADLTDSATQDVPLLRLRLTKPKTDKKVKWTEGTVDNEHMNKKKSKCCCIYTKPRSHLEDSSSDDDEDKDCDHCRGHVEKKNEVPDTPSNNYSEVAAEPT